MFYHYFCDKKKEFPFRDLPEPVLETSEIISRFEQAASTKEVAQRESQIAELTQQLPECNRVLLAWVILHLDHITMCVSIFFFFGR